MSFKSPENMNFRRILLIFIFLIFHNDVNSLSIRKFSRQAKLDEKFTVEWNVDLDKKEVEFHTIVETLGFVGFGISPNGGMKHADIVIGGVHSNNTEYFSVKYYIF